MTNTPTANDQNIQIGRREGAGIPFHGSIHYVEIKGNGSTQGLCDFRDKTQGDWSDCEDGGAGTAVSDGYGNDWYVEIYTNMGYEMVTFTPNGDGTNTNVVDEADGTTNIYTSVDEDPDHNPTTTNYIGTKELDGSIFFDVTATPSDMDSMDTPLTVRADVDPQDFAADTCTLYAQMFASNESTNYTDEVSLATQASSGLVTADLTVNATGLAASKTDWDAARLRLRWDYTA
jgi:hypothetical protein